MAAMARWCFRHRAWVLVGWLALLVILGAGGRAVGSAYADSLTLPGTGSSAAQTLIGQAFPGHAGDQDTIVWRASSTGGVRAPAVQARITAMLAKVAAAPAVASVTSPYAARGTAQISRNGHIAYATVVFGAQANTLAKQDVIRVVNLAEAARAPGLQVELGGQAIENNLRPSIGITAGVGVIAAGVVLFIAFGSLLAMLLPLAVAIACAGLGPDGRRAGLARGQHSHNRPGAGRLDRAGRGHRLRAVHRHPAPRQHQGRDDPGRGGGPGAEHLRPGGPVRRGHGVHRPARHAHSAHQLHRRPGHRRRDYRGVHGGRRGHLAARAAGRAGAAGAVPQGTPAAGRRRPRASTPHPGHGPGWPDSCSAAPSRSPSPPPP